MFFKDIPYVSPHFANVNQSFSEGMSKMLPTSGKPLGPGGSGGFRALEKTDFKIYTRNRRAMARTALDTMASRTSPERKAEER